MQIGDGIQREPASEQVNFSHLLKTGTLPETEDQVFVSSKY